MRSSLLAVLMLLPGIAYAIDKVIPDGGGHGSNWRSNGLCGRRVSGWVLQIEVADESKALPAIVNSILDADPLQLAPGCSFIGGWRGGINEKEDLEFRVTRWIPESRLEKLIKEISSHGKVRYLNELQSQGTFDDSLVKDFERAQARWKGDPKLDWDLVEKRIVREQIQYLEPKVRSFEETRDKIPLHVVVVRKRGLIDLNQGATVEGITDYGDQPTWLGLESRLKSGDVDERRRAAFRLTRLAPSSFGDADIGGVGLVLQSSSSGTIIVANIDPESPLQKKIARGDSIEQIDGESVKGNLQAALNKMRGKPDTTVSAEIVKASGDRTSVRARCVVIFPSAKRFEDAVFDAAKDSDPVVAQLAIQALRSPSVDKGSSRALMAMIGHDVPRVRLVAIQALQFSLWNGTPN